MSPPHVLEIFNGGRVFGANQSARRVAFTCLPEAGCPFALETRRSVPPARTVERPPTAGECVEAPIPLRPSAARPATRPSCTPCTRPLATMNQAPVSTPACLRLCMRERRCRRPRGVRCVSVGQVHMARARALRRCAPQRAGTDACPGSGAGSNMWPFRPKFALPFAPVCQTVSLGAQLTVAWTGEASEANPAPATAAQRDTAR